MKKKLKTAFGKIFNRKSKTGIILTIVALVEILAIMVVSTSAWIESISSIKVYTTAQTTSGGTKGTVLNKLKQQMGLAYNNNTDIDLTQYFRPSGDYHLSGASSVDGNAMYFPETNTQSGNDTTKYRVGTINDKNVNYISFTVKTTTANIALAFGGTPTIKFGGTALTGEAMKLVRFSVGNGSTFKVFSLASEFEDTVISGENPTDTATSVVRSFSDYAVGGSNLVTTTTNNGFLTFSMWIQDPYGDSSAVYNKKALTVENLSLVAVKPFTLKSTYMNSSGTYVAGDTGGTVAVNNSEFGSTAVAYLKDGSVVTLKASPNTTNGYSFNAWSKTADGSAFAPSGTSATGGTAFNSGNCTIVNGVYQITYTFYSSHYSGDYELYAQFNDRHILYLKPNYKHLQGTSNTSVGNSNGNITFGAYIWGSVNGVFTKEWYKGTYDSTKAAYKFTYKGSANSVIFCYMAPGWTVQAMSGNTDPNWSSRYLQTYDLSFPLENGEYTYVVTSRRYPYTGSNGNNHVIGYWEHSYAKINIAKCTDTASQNSSNTVSMYLNDAYIHYEGAATETRLSSTSSLTFDGKTYTTDGSGNALSHPYYATVTLNNSPGSLYNFDGWYRNAAGTGSKLTATELANLTAANANAVNNGTTYYAKFVEKPAMWSVKYGTSGGSNWSTLTLNQSSSNSHVFTATKSMTIGEHFWFKVHDDKNTSDWYANGQSYNNIIADTVINAATLNTSGTDMEFTAGRTGTYTFSFNDSTKKLTVTAASSATLPSVYLYCSKNSGTWGNGATFSRTSTTSNEMTCTYALNEGDELTFKVRDSSRNEYYGNGGRYDGYTTTTLLDNGTLTTSGNDIYIHAHKGTYTFKFDYSTKKLTITCSFSNITITFDFSSATWVGDASAVITFYDDSGEVKLSGSGNTRTVSIASNRGNGTNVGFNRWQSWTSSSNHGTWWNGWDNSHCGSRGFKTTYKVTGDNAGSWQ